MFVGGAQAASGALLLVGLLASSTRFFWLGSLGIGIGAIVVTVQVVQAVVESSKDALKAVLLELLAQIRAVKCSWDGGVVVDSLGIRPLVDGIDALANDAGVLVIDPLAHSPELRRRTLTRIERLGFDKGLAQRLVVDGGLLDARRDFEARSLGGP